MAIVALCTGYTLIGPVDTENQQNSTLPVLDEIAREISFGVTVALANEVQLHVSVIDRYEDK